MRTKISAFLSHHALFYGCVLRPCPTCAVLMILRDGRPLKEAFAVDPSFIVRGSAKRRAPALDTSP